MIYFASFAFPLLLQLFDAVQRSLTKFKVVLRSFIKAAGFDTFAFVASFTFPLIMQYFSAIQCSLATFSLALRIFTHFTFAASFIFLRLLLIVLNVPYSIVI